MRTRQQAHTVVDLTAAERIVDLTDDDDTVRDPLALTAAKRVVDLTDDDGTPANPRTLFETKHLKSSVVKQEDNGGATHSIKDEPVHDGILPKVDPDDKLPQNDLADHDATITLRSGKSFALAGPGSKVGTSAWGSLSMTPPQTPKTRMPQFSHLKGKALVTAIEKLPKWVQMQECVPWFSDSQIMLVYLREARGIPVANAGRPNGPMVDAMAKQGYPWQEGRPQSTRGAWANIYSGLKYKMDDVFSTIKADRPTPGSYADATSNGDQQYLSPLPKPNYQETLLRLSGPIGEEFLLLDGYYTPPTTQAGLDFIYGPHSFNKAGSRLAHACLEAKMEMFWDLNLLNFLTGEFFIILRSLDPELKPWKPGEDIFEVNPQMKDKQHPVHHCLPVEFWTRAYHDQTGVHAGTDGSQRRDLCTVTVIVFCRKHGRFEKLRWTFAKYFHLCARFFNWQQWCDTVANNDNAVRRQTDIRSEDGKYASVQGIV